MIFGASRRFALPAIAACALLFPLRPAGAGDAPAWIRFFGGPGSAVTDVVTGPEGVWVTGRITDDGTRPALWVALLDGGGRVRWQQRLPARGYQLHPKLVPGRKTVRVIAGVPSPSTPAPDGGSLTASGLWIGTLTREGRLAAQHVLAPHRVTVVQAVSPTGEGGVLLAGLAETGTDTSGKGWLARLDADGNLAWEHLLPQVSWLSSLSNAGSGEWLIAGTYHEKGDEPRPWLAVVDGKGRIGRSWKPRIRDFSLSGALAVSDALWLAGEGDASRGGARLFRVERSDGGVREYPVTGFSVLRLVSAGPGGILAGGDGIGEKPPDDPESAPGWLRLSKDGPPPEDPQGPSAPGKAIRLQNLPHGELHAWSFPALGTGGSGHCAPAAGGAVPDGGSWVGCFGPASAIPSREIPGP